MVALRDMWGRRQPSVGGGAYDDPDKIVQMKRGVEDSVGVGAHDDPDKIVQMKRAVEGASPYHFCERLLLLRCIYGIAV